jgi:hypothetical protein
MAVSSSLGAPGHASDVTHVGAGTRRLPLMSIREVVVAPSSPCLHALSAAGLAIAADVAPRGLALEQSGVTWIAGRQGGRGPPLYTSKLSRLDVLRQISSLDGVPVQSLRAAAISIGSLF